MAEVSGFFNSKDNDRKYYISFWAEYFASFIGNGVYFGGNFLKVNPPTGSQYMTVEVSEGKGWINGYYYALKGGVKTLPISPAHGTMSRKDNIVLQLDLREDKRLIETIVVTGTSSSAPVAPVIRRDDAIYQLKLAEIYIAAGATRVTENNITDYRLNSSTCGIVSSVVPTNLTYDKLFSQMTSELNRRMSEWDTTKTQQKNQWNEQMSTQRNEFNAKKTEVQTWYDSIKIDIAKLQTIDFDNIYPIKGAIKETVFNSATKITETIKESATKRNVATKITDFLANGKIQSTYTVYDKNGTSILLSTVTTTTFNADGTITEVII